MLVIISPAKTLDYKTQIPKVTTTLPSLTQKSLELVELCRKFPPDELASLMKISDKLASLNVARFADWRFEHTEENARAALFAFKGDVYTGLDALNLKEEQIYFAQDHLRILSGLYGILRPLDLLEPYRLEMGTKLNNASGKNLYDFWGNIITDEVNKALEAQGDDLLINLASDEYFSAVKAQNIKGTIIKPIFLDEKNGKYKVISFYAKKARGLMVRFMLEHQISQLEKLKEFNYQGYEYCESESSSQEWVFKRSEQTALLHK